MSPEPMSSSTASAISVTTSVPRMRCRARLSPEPALPSRSGVSTSPLVAWSAGASPNASPANTVAPSTASSTIGSSWNFIQ